MLPLKRFFLPTWLLYLLLLVILELLADLLAKQFAVSGNLFFVALSLLGFLAANMAWLASLRTGAMLGKGAILFAMLSSIGAVLIGLFIYHEQRTPIQEIGLVLGIIAFALFSFG